MDPFPNSFYDVRDRIAAARARVGRDPASVTLVGASKTVAATNLEWFYDLGLEHFGENYIQEGIAKIRHFEAIERKPHWHLIGALQSNKAREAVQHFELVHSVGRTSVAKELNKEAEKIGKLQRVLLQVNFDHESSKGGVAPDALPALLDQVKAFQNLRVEGLMSLPPYHEDPEAMRPFHRQLRQLSESLAFETEGAPLLSMGMSNDFEVAIEEGATHIRVGTALFGVRG